MNPVEKFLETYASEKTKRVYKSHLKVYFDFLKTDPELYFKGKRDYVKDLSAWLDFNQSKSPMTAQSRFNCVILFLEDNDIDIKKKDLKILKRKRQKGKPITLDSIPTNEELKQILSHAFLKEKAIILIATSSGMRINEILSLEKEDVDLNSNPVKIFIRSKTAKFGKSRYCFISDEAKNSLLEWYKVRDKFFKSAVSKCNSRVEPLMIKNPDDTTIFPVTYGTFVNNFHRLLRETELNQRDRQTRFYRYHVHCLRKFFKTKMIGAGIQTEIVNILLGQTGYLESSYIRFSEEDIKKAYLQGVRSVLIYEKSPELDEINEKMAEKDKQIQSLLENQKLMELRMQGLENKLDIEKIKNGKK